MSNFAELDLVMSLNFFGQGGREGRMGGRIKNNLPRPSLRHSSRQLGLHYLQHLNSKWPVNLTGRERQRQRERERERKRDRERERERERETERERERRNGGLNCLSVTGQPKSGYGRSDKVGWGGGG